MDEKIPEIKVSSDGKLIVIDSAEAIKKIVELLGVVQLFPMSKDESDKYRKVYAELREIIENNKYLNNDE